MTRERHHRLGDRLLERGMLELTSLDVALAEQRRAHRPLGEILVSLGFVRERDIAELMGEDLGLPFLSASDITPDTELLESLTESFVREASAFPYALESGVLRLAMTHPDDPIQISRVRERFPYPLEIAITTERDLSELVSTHLRSDAQEVAKIFEEIRAEAELDEEAAPIERLTTAILHDAIRRGATDIHIEPEEQVTRVRFRIDGILHGVEGLPVELTPAVISRIKVLSRLDISERRRPQDGRFQMPADQKTVDFRVSILPCPFGENAVLRVLDSGLSMLRLAELGISDEHQALLRSVTERSHGIFLVTGPTGSGKTTTLYSLLQEIDGLSRKIATIEDPIEYRLPLVRQSQVDPGIGYDFQNGLRALLRQDPDVILIGEIRDAETAEMAIRAAMTGHLVFATMHTNSSIGAVPRLMELGIDRFLIEDTLIGTMGQRLVRTLCKSCKSSRAPRDDERAWLGDGVSEVWEANGCERCAESGYSGRTAIAELFLPPTELESIVEAALVPKQVVVDGQRVGYYSSKDEGQRAVRRGRTTFAEVMRVNRSIRLEGESRAS